MKTAYSMMHSFGLTLHMSVAPASVWCGEGSIEKK